MSTVPPTDAEIDEWMDENVLIYITNVLPNNPTWEGESLKFWVIAYTQNDDTKQYVATNADPTTNIGERFRLNGLVEAYGQVRIRAYDGIVTFPSQPPATSVALSENQQDYYNDSANWAVEP